MSENNNIQAKWQAIEWEKIFTKYTFDGRLVFKIYKEQKT